VTDIAPAFIEQSRRLLTYSYLPRIEGAVRGLSTENVWWRANDQSNSIGNLILHLDGNLRQWLVSGIGGAPDVRDRQQEFNRLDGWSGHDLVLRLRRTVEEADAVLAKVDPEDLLTAKRIQGYDVTVMRAIYTAVEHFSMHTGQIILLAKMWKGDLGFYDVSEGEPRPMWPGGVAGH
jgi:hypothetical protein